MRILIVDDNIAIQEIIGDVLSVEGYDIEKSSTVKDACEKIDSFNPGIIILDSSVGSESGYKVLDGLSSDSPVRVIVLTKGKEVLPRDTPFIKASIQKPFSTEEIMEKVHAVEEDIASSHKGKLFKFKWFSKQTKTEPEEEIPGVRFGKSYVIFENEPDTVYKVAWQLMSRGCDMLIITSGKIKMITDRFKNDQGLEVKTIGMSVRPRMGYVEISKLGTLMDNIKKFLEEKDRPVVVFDSLEEVIDANGLNTVVRMLYQVIHGDVKKVSTLIVSTRDDTLTEKDKELFTHEMELYVNREEN